MFPVKFIVRLTSKWPKHLTVNLTLPFSTKVFFSNLQNKMDSAVKSEKTSIKYYNDLEKSSSDKRHYRAMELENKLKIILVSDPDTDKAAGALMVTVGSMSEPDYLPGLAHFCEHMLFLGTEKYPSENEYSKFLADHGGHCNASTGLDQTTYYFDVMPDHLGGALDRFAQFFLCPLFTESATGREVLAVNSEHEKNISSDPWRLDQLEKSTSKENHPYNSFGTGNTETLVTIPKEKGIDVREELLKFHKRWYSSNMMTVAILGKESLDELEKMALPLFSDVVNKDVERPEWTEHPLGPEQLKMKGYVVPITDYRNLSVSFPIPDLGKFYKSGPASYLSHLIGHEGPGSLLSAFKARGWCNQLVSSRRHVAKGFGFFNISVDLTEEGVKHEDDIITLLFQYINMLKKVGPQKWIFEEYQQILQMGYDFKDKELPRTHVSNLVYNMQKYPLEEILKAPYLLTEWQPEVIEMVTEYLKPSNVRIAVIAKKFESIADKTEKYYGTKYALEKIPETTIEEWENCGYCDELRLPDVNDFITSNFQIYPLDETKKAEPHPVIIHDSPLTRVWFKQDDEFFMPKANLKFEIVSPLAYFDPINCNMTYMYVTLLMDALNEYAYAAELAGLEWGLYNTAYGMLLVISGYNDKQHVLLDKILEKMTNFEIDPKRFDILKEKYVRSLKNFEVDQPYKQSSYYITSILFEHVWTMDDLLGATQELTVERLKEFIPQLLSKLHIECLIHGNATSEKALSLVQILEDRLKANVALRPLLPRQLLRNREIQLGDGLHFMYEATNKHHKNSCTEVYYQCCLQSTETNVLLELLVQMLHEPCFNVLRTQEQLGYIVSSRVRRSSSVQGFHVLVQSDRHPNYLNQRIEAFVIQAREIIENMSDEEFERHRESLAAIRLEKPKKLKMLSVRFWKEISSQQYHFDRDEVEVAYLRTVTKKDVVDFFDKYIKNDAPNRHKLSVHVLSVSDGGAGTLPQPDEESLSLSTDGLLKPPPYVAPTRIEDVTKFKSSQSLFPLAQPYMNISAANTKSKL